MAKVKQPTTPNAESNIPVDPPVESSAVVAEPTVNEAAEAQPKTISMDTEDFTGLMIATRALVLAAEKRMGTSASEVVAVKALLFKFQNLGGV